MGVSTKTRILSDQGLKNFERNLQIKDETFF